MLAHATAEDKTPQCDGADVLQISYVMGAARHMA